MAEVTVLWPLKQKCFGCLALNTFPHGFTFSAFERAAQALSSFSERQTGWEFCGETGFWVTVTSKGPPTAENR